MSFVIRSHNDVWLRTASCAALLLLLCAATACTVTETPFVRTASNAGSAFAAAATTLSYAHSGKVTFAYAASSFADFQSELSGTDQALAAQSGGDRRTLQHLLALYAAAMRVIDAPCLSTSCAWRGQVQVLNQASEAFLKVGGS